MFRTKLQSLIWGPVHGCHSTGTLLCACVKVRPDCGEMCSVTIAFRWYYQITVTSWARRCAKRQNLWELLSGKNFLYNIIDRKVKPFIYLLQKMLPHPLSVSYSTLSPILKNCPAEIFPLQKKLKKFSTLKNSPNPPERPQNLLVSNTKLFKHILKHLKYLNHTIHFYTFILKKVVSCKI